MKRYIIIFVMVTLAMRTTYAQWIYQYTAANTINKIFVLNPDTVYAVGNNGLLVRTKDGGNNWEQINLNTNEYLYDIVFISNSKGYLCGSNAKLLKSNDGGNTWTACPISTNLDLFCLSFIDENVGWIGGASNQATPFTGADSGIIVRTNNGGQNFLPAVTFNQGIFHLGALNSDTCFALANSPYSVSTTTYNNILRSINGGHGWNILYQNTNPVAGLPVTLTAESFFHNGIGYVSPYQGPLLKTTNYGNTWDTISTLFYPCRDFSFPSQTTGYYASFDEFMGVGGIFKTTDGGQGWISQNPLHFACVSFANDTIGYSASVDGEIFKTVNGGVVGINENTNKDVRILITPNPFRSEITINIDLDFRHFQGYSLKCEIYSASGNKVLVKEIEGKSTRIQELKEASPGIYFIRILYGQGEVYLKKLLKTN